jgi:hypothetical protein
MTSQLLKNDKIDKIARNVKIPCVECGKMLKFHIENDVVIEGEGRIVCNIPGAVCSDCIELVLDKVEDPPGLVCIKNLNPIMAEEFLLNFKFLLPSFQAADFFISLFPENGSVYADRSTSRPFVTEDARPTSRILELWGKIDFL